MKRLLAVLLSWTAVAAPLGLLIGRAIHIADLRAPTPLVMQPVAPRSPTATFPPTEGELTATVAADAVSCGRKDQRRGAQTRASSLTGARSAM